MARKIVDVRGLAEILPLSIHQIYKATRHPEYPLPYKKFGRKLLFDVSHVQRWFEQLPGRDLTL